MPVYSFSNWNPERNRTKFGASPLSENDTLKSYEKRKRIENQLYERTPVQVPFLVQRAEDTAGFACAECVFSKAPKRCLSP